MQDSSNSKLISVIRDRVPPYINLANYLMETLEIGKEAAYRRIRDQIPFTFEEVKKLSLDLDFSIDEVIWKSNDRHIILKQKKEIHNNPRKMFYETLNNFYNLFTKLCSVTVNEMIGVYNELQIFFLLGSPYLFNFYYLKWMYQVAEEFPKFSISGTAIPDEIDSIRKKFFYYARQPHSEHSVYILDQNFFLNTIRQIHYYYKRKFITEDELNVIKEELIELINYIESLTQNGTDLIHSKFVFYISILNLQSNSLFASYDGNEEVYYDLYSSAPLRIVAPEICNKQKKWIESLKKTSILITECSEILQVDFFNKQREYVDNIRNHSFFNFW